MTPRIQSLLNFTFDRKQNAFRRDVDWAPMLARFVTDGVSDMVRAFSYWAGEAVFEDNVWEADGAPYCRCHGRPRSGLRFLYPDHLDQIHCDDAAEIEAQSANPGLFRDRFPW